MVRLELRTRPVFGTVQETILEVVVETRIQEVTLLAVVVTTQTVRLAVVKVDCRMLA